MALSNNYNFEARQGDDFTVQFTVRQTDNSPLDLTGYTARLHVRKTFGSAATTIVATTENAKLSIDTPTAGVVNWYVAASDTTAVQFRGDNETQELVYDLELVSAANKVISPARGTITLYREVTRQP